MRRTLMTAGLTGVLTLATAVPAFACAALIGPNGSVQVSRTTTLVAYHDGVEHYITSFEYAGGGAEFGSIIPLPGIPSDVKRGGDWTLQRLVQETQPPPDLEFAAADAAAAPREAEVLQEVEIDALDVTILRGGGDAVGAWAEENGFTLSPDFPEVLDFYAERSPIFMAARYDLERAQQSATGVGEGTPVHLTIPTDRPWVPLRILGAGSGPEERIEADVYLLTDSEPTVLPFPNSRMALEVSRPATPALLNDLRDDKGMKWVPEEAWLSYLRLDIPAGGLVYDLAIDPTGESLPSLVDAGLAPAVARAAGAAEDGAPLLVIGLLTAAVACAVIVIRRSVTGAAAA